MEQSRFITEVHARKCIWTTKVKANTDRIEKRQAWEEVAAKMYNDYHNFSDDDKREAVLELQRKWKSLKDYYKRRNRKEDIDEKTKRMKPIVELLQFLDKIPPHSNIKYPTNKRYKRVANKHKSSHESQYVEESIMGQESNMNFFQTLLDELRYLNDRQRFEFKLGVMNLIKKIKYDEDIENTSDHTDTIQQCPSYDNPIASYESPPQSTSPLTIEVGSAQCNEQILTTTYYSELENIFSEQPNLNANNFSEISRDKNQ